MTRPAARGSDPKNSPDFLRQKEGIRPMGMTVGIKSSGDRHLDLHFSSSNHDGNGKWGALHISICAMHSEGGEDVPLQMLQCELTHDDLDRLIKELQDAKALLAGEDANQYATVDGSWLGPIYPKLMTQLEPEAICLQCGYRADRHSYSGACIEKLPMGMIRFSKTERFRS